MNARRCSLCYVGLIALEIPTRLLDAIAVRLDGQSWPWVAMPLIWVADCIERCSERLERAWRGNADDTR